MDDEQHAMEISSDSDSDDEFMISYFHRMNQKANDLNFLAVALLMDEEEEEAQNNSWGGSAPGKSANLQRDFEGAAQRLIQKYFSGENSSYTEEQFTRRFRAPRSVFSKVWSAIEGKGPFKQHMDRVTGKPGINPLVRFVACWRVLAYGDSMDRNDENFEISESTLNNSFKAMCKLIKNEFGPQYLNRCPTKDELKRVMRANKARGFPGMFASWDCKHFPWKLCPVALAGQHKGKGEKNTLVLEAICDADTYIWYTFFGEPGSLNDLNILDKSSIVGSILTGEMDLRLPEELHYTINGTKRDYLYFLVDGIYPRWPIFISTIANAPENSKEKIFSTYQEAVRKDIERAFGWRAGVLVAQFHILDRPLRFWRTETIADVLDTCIILHNMVVEERRHNFFTGTYQEENEEEPPEMEENHHQVSLFGSLEEEEEEQDGQAAAQLNLRVFAIDAALKNEIEHEALKDDLKEHIFSKRGSENN